MKPTSCKIKMHFVLQIAEMKLQKWKKREEKSALIVMQPVMPAFACNPTFRRLKCKKRHLSNSFNNLFADISLPIFSP